MYGEQFDIFLRRKDLYKLNKREFLAPFEELSSTLGSKMLSSSLRSLGSLYFHCILLHPKS